MLALDAASGEERWRFDPPSPRLGAITVADGTIWMMLRNANILAVRADSGRLIARFKDLELDLSSVRGLAHRPALIGRHVLAPISVALLGFETPGK